MRTGASYGRSLVLTGDRRKMGYFARANMNRFDVVSTAGALGAPPGFNLDTESGKSTDCPPGYVFAEGSCRKILQSYTSEVGPVTDWANPYGVAPTENPIFGFFKTLFGSKSPAAAPPLVAAQVSSPGVEAAATAGMFVGLAGIAYGVVKKKPKVALGAAAVGAALVFLPKMFSGRANPFAGTPDDSVYKRR